MHTYGERVRQACARKEGGGEGAESGPAAASLEPSRMLRARGPVQRMLAGGQPCPLPRDRDQEGFKTGRHKQIGYMN